MQDQKSRIRELNDGLRCDHRGGAIVVTAGTRSMGADFVAAVDIALKNVAFDSDNDPYCERDFGAVEVMGRRIFFEIDHYDLELRFGSPDPADENVTHRVMTIMLAEEY